MLLQLKPLFQFLLSIYDKQSDGHEAPTATALNGLLMALEQLVRSNKFTTIVVLGMKKTATQYNTETTSTVACS